MSTILDALRKLQRERAAQSPAKDLRGSIISETPLSRARPRGSGSRWIALALVLLGVGSGGYALYLSGKLDALLARFQSEETVTSEEEFALLEREVLEREAAAAPAESVPHAELPARTPEVTPIPRARADTPETAAERARLEAALVNARVAQEAQRQAELDAAAQPLAPTPQPPAPAITAAPPAAAPPAPVIETKPKPVARKPAAPAVAAKPKPVAETPAPRRTPEPSAEAASSSSSFPAVRVESIRWHPVAERRVASLHFDRQDAPEAREGDIVAGVLVYRIDPGSVELRVGSAQRTVSPGP